MRKWLPVLFVATLGATPPSEPMTIQDHENPIERRVETRYRCRDGNRSLTLVYDRQTRARLASAVRRGVRLSATALAEVNRAIARLDGVQSITPQCSGPHDLLIVIGVVERQRSAVFINWSAGGMRATEPQPIGF